jgi:ribonucleoside-diphosphate reductase alpha chain
VFDFLIYVKNHGAEAVCPCDLFFTLFDSRFIYEAVEENGEWTLMCLHECPGLASRYAQRRRKLYTFKYEQEGKGRKLSRHKTFGLPFPISQIETGLFVLFTKMRRMPNLNQQNLGTIVV